MIRRLLSALPRSPNFWGALVVIGAVALAASSLGPVSGAANSAGGGAELTAAARLRWSWEQGAHRPWWMQHLAPDMPLSGRYSPSALTYALAALTWLGMTPEVALNLLGALALLAGALGVYLLARRFLPPGSASLAGVAFALSPYALMQTYVRGDYTVLWLAALTPYWMWGWAELSARGSRRGYIALATATAGLIGLASLALLPILPLLLLYAEWRAFREGQSHRPALVLSVLSGALASAVVALPAWVAIIGGATDAAGSPAWPAPASLALGDLLVWPRALDVRSVSDLLPLGLGGHLVLLALPAVLHLRRQTNPQRGHVIFMLAAVVAYSLVAHGVAAWVHARVPSMPAALDPYAALGPAAMALALLVGAGVEAWSAGGRIAGRLAFLIALMLMVWGAGPYLFPRTPYPDGIQLSRAEALQVPAPLGRPSVATWPLSEAYARSGGVIASAGAPTTQVTLLAAGPDWVELSAPGRQGSALLPFRYSGAVSASVDGRAQPIARDPETGLMSLPLGSDGVHTVVLVITRSATGRWGTWLTLLGLAGLLLGLAVVGRTRSLRVRGPVVGKGILDLRWPALAMGLVVVVQMAYVAPRTTWFRRVSPPGAVEGVQHPREDVLGGKVALLGYDLVRNLPPQGETLGLTLYWRALEPLASDYRAFVQLVAPADGRVLWRAESALPGGLPTSAWVPDLYVRDAHGDILPPALPAARYQLRVGLYDQVAGQALAGADGEASIYLQDIQVLYHYPLDVKRFPGREWYRLGEGATLLGYDLTRKDLHSGELATLTLFWRTETPIAERLKRFVHLVSAEGVTVAQWEDWPVEGTYPTDLWLRQHTIADVLELSVPASALPGEYRLEVGLRDPVTLGRPPVTRRGSDPVAGGAVTLPVRVVVRE